MPDDAAWRKSGAFTMREELQAMQLEKFDVWMRALVTLMATRKTELPEPLPLILRPGDDREALESERDQDQRRQAGEVSIGEFVAEQRRLARAIGQA